jgi:predicted flap endonuclease-1-like 5' DNA nuclease
MGLLDAIKSALGLGSSSRDEEPDASTERAVKDSPAAAGTDAGGSTASVTETPPETPEGDDVAEAAEPAEAAGPASQVEAPDEATDSEADDGAAEPTGSGDEAAGTGSASPADESPDDGAAEPAEAAGAATDHAAAAEPAADEPADPATDDAASVETISGIGPAYAARLADAGVESVPDLLAADADALAEETGISAKRIGRWMERAREA